MSDREYTLEIGDLKFTCEYIVENNDRLNFTEDAKCNICNNEVKCKMYVKDHNRRLSRAKTLKQINEIEELDKVIVEVYKTKENEINTYLGLSFLFEDHKRKKQKQTIYLNAEWVRLGRQPRKRKVNKKLLSRIREGNIPTITLKSAREQLKEKIKNTDHIPIISLSTDRGSQKVTIPCRKQKETTQ